MCTKKAVRFCVFALILMTTVLPTSHVIQKNDICMDYQVRAKKIVVKEKTVNGVRYVRRWDVTNNKWIDTEWKRVD